MITPPVYITHCSFNTSVTLSRFTFVHKATASDCRSTTSEGGGYNYDSTAIRPRYDHSTT